MKKKQSEKTIRQQTARSKYIVLMCIKYTDITNIDQNTGYLYTIHILKKIAEAYFENDVHQIYAFYLQFIMYFQTC